MLLNKKNQNKILEKFFLIFYIDKNNWTYF